MKRLNAKLFAHSGIELLLKLSAAHSILKKLVNGPCALLLLAKTFQSLLWGETKFVSRIKNTL